MDSNAKTAELERLIRVSLVSWKLRQREAIEMKQISISVFLAADFVIVNDSRGL